MCLRRGSHVCPMTLPGSDGRFGLCNCGFRVVLGLALPGPALGTVPSCLNSFPRDAFGLCHFGTILGRRRVFGKAETAGPACWKAGAARCRHVGLGWRMGHVCAGTTAPRIILRRHARGRPDLTAVLARQTGQKNMRIAFPLRGAISARQARCQTRTGRDGTGWKGS